MPPVLDFYAKEVPGLRKGAGDNYTGYCPIHGETPGKSKPAFSVNIRTGAWCCFAGCGGGGIPQFLIALGQPRTKIDKTVERLSKFVEKSVKKRPVIAQEGVFRTPHPLPERILGFYDLRPDALIAEGFNEEVLCRNDVGYDDDLDRITFPIRDMYGTFSGLMGKCLNPDSRWKYKLYGPAEFAGYGFKDYEMDKGSYMWRWEQVFPRLIQDRHQVLYVVEGFKAALWMVQWGYENTVALMGSRFTDVHKAFLQLVGCPVVLCLDHDRAGILGTDKVIRTLTGIRKSVIDYPQVDFTFQPDDLSPGELHQALSHPLSTTTWKRRYHGKIRTAKQHPR